MSNYKVNLKNFFPAYRIQRVHKTLIKEAQSIASGIRVICDGITIEGDNAKAQQSIAELVYSLLHHHTPIQALTTDQRKNPALVNYHATIEQASKTLQKVRKALAVQNPEYTLTVVRTLEKLYSDFKILASIID